MLCHSFTGCMHSSIVAVSCNSFDCFYARCNHCAYENIQRKLAQFLHKREYEYYPFLYPSMFVSGIVGLDTLELRRKYVPLHILHYYYLIIERIDNPSVRDNIHFYLPYRYLRGRRRRRLLACPPSQQSSRAGNCLTGFDLILVPNFSYVQIHILIMFQ